MNRNETYIVSRIENGANPVDALAALMSEKDPTFLLEDLEKEAENGKLSAILHRPRFKSLNLSIPFLQKWIVYPSGLVRSFMSYANINKIVDLKDKSIVVTTHPNITDYEDLGGDKLVGIPVAREREGVKYIGINKGDINLSRSLLLMIENPVYIPVLRYALAGGRGFIYGTWGLNQPLPTNICGTYYWLEPDSGIYLLSNKTLVIPNRNVGLFVLLGTDKNIFKDVIDNYYTYNGKDNIKEQSKDIFINKIMINYDRALKGEQPLNEYNLNRTLWPDGMDPFSPIGDMEIELCNLARTAGIDAMIMVREDTHKYRYASEVIDTRPRDKSYNSLYGSL